MFLLCPPPIPGKGILDNIAHGPIIQVITVVQSQWLIEQKTSFMERSCAQEAIGNDEYGFRAWQLFLGSTMHPMYFRLLEIMRYWDKHYPHKGLFPPVVGIK